MSLSTEQRSMLDAMFETMDHSEISECSDMLRRETRMRRELKAANNKRALKVGSVVEWSGSKSGACTGEVVRVKRKKAIVKQTNGGNLKYNGTNWDIPLSMLTVVG